jgi:hypothetical protein
MKSDYMGLSALEGWVVISEIMLAILGFYFYNGKYVNWILIVLNRI